MFAMNAIVAAALAVLQLLSVAGAASAACATLAGPENMVVVLAPTPFYSWKQCKCSPGVPFPPSSLPPVHLF